MARLHFNIPNNEQFFFHAALLMFQQGLQSQSLGRPRSTKQWPCHFRLHDCSRNRLMTRPFMSDDAQQYWNAWPWAATYGANNTTKLLCTWHVDRAWRKALWQEHIGDADSLALVYHQLRLLLSEPDKRSVMFCYSNSCHFSCHGQPSCFFDYFRGTYALTL